MNILFFSQAAWDNKNSVGNTFSNWFDGKPWKDDSFFHMYTRKKMPDNHMNITYYNISAVDIIKGIVRNRDKGTRFNTESLPLIQLANEKTCINEQKNINRIHKGKNNIIYYGYELIWRSKLWKDKSFKDFIRMASPDVFFAFATSPYILWPLIRYLKKHTACKVVLLVADDVYGNYDQCAFYRRGYLKRELEKCILAADKLYGISDEMSELYRKRFGKPVTTLYKGCDLSAEPKKHLNQPLRFVYAGNLLWGRDDTLAQVAEALEKLNKDSQKAILEIYTGTTITEQIRQKLEKGKNSQILGSRSYEEIKQIMHEADVVLHVESFEEQQKDTVRYSFSTKIIDCLQSGSQVLGIGPAGISSIEYLKKVDGAVVIDQQGQVSYVVEELIQKNKILENAKQTRQYALQKHELNSVQEKLRDEFEKLLLKNPNT